MAENKKTSNSSWVTTEHKTPSTSQKSSSGNGNYINTNSRDSATYSSHKPVTNKSAGPSGSPKK